MSAFDAQQRREVANRGRFWDWPSVRAAVEAARGARECADVESDEAERAREAELWAGAANAANDYLPSFFIESTAGEGTMEPPQYDYKRFPFCWFSPLRKEPEPEPTLVDTLWRDEHK